MSDPQQQLLRSLDEQRAEYVRRRGLAMPLAGSIVWTLIGIAGAFLPPILAVWSLCIGTGFIAYLGMMLSRFTLGNPDRGWVPHDTRDQIVDFVRRWSEKTEIGAWRFIRWLDITASKFYCWRDRYGKLNQHNGWVPRDFWLEDWEKQAIIAFHLKNPLEGYRRLTFMMLDADIVAVSPASMWRVLSRAGLLRKWNGKPSKKGTGSEQPPQPHQHWHIDVSYLNVCATFYYLCSILDGYSRFLVHWDLRSQ